MFNIILNINLSVNVLTIYIKKYFALIINLFIYLSNLL